VDLLLVDLEGDDACNWELVSELRQQTPLASLPVIGMLSKQTQDSLLDQAVVDVYLSKPFDYEALYAALNRALVLKQQRAMLG
jgi:CheY-like chemotaxis protein